MLVVLLGMLAGLGVQGRAALAAQVIELTQTGCQFLEPEGKDHAFAPGRAEDCRRINDKTASQRLAASEVLHLRPGRYVFRVRNKNVPYTLGFWLRGQGLGRLTLPSVSGGGIETGQAKDYEIELVPGEYVYSCPLNPTPDYRLVVSAGEE